MSDYRPDADPLLPSPLLRSEGAGAGAAAAREQVEQVMRKALAEAISRSEDLALGESDGIYPPPLLPGAAAYRDCDIWNADYRARSRVPVQPDDEKLDLVTRDDPAYRTALGSMIRLGIPSPGAVG